VPTSPEKTRLRIVSIFLVFPYDLKNCLGKNYGRCCVFKKIILLFRFQSYEVIIGPLLVDCNNFFIADPGKQNIEDISLYPVNRMEKLYFYLVNKIKIIYICLVCKII
jgi:hypothetical protein